MKKQLLLGIMMIFFLGTSIFAGISDPSGANDKTAVKDTKENKLSAEELSRMTRRAETDNLKTENITNKEASNSNNKLLPSNQVIVEGRHRHGYYIGGGTLLLIIILVLILA